MINIDKLEVRRRDQQMLFTAERLSLGHEQNRGKVFGVVGPSGCGKTTLLKALLQLLPDGLVTVDQVQRSYSRPAYFSQRPVIFPHLNAEENAHYFATTAAHQTRHAGISGRVKELARYLRVDFAALNRTGTENWSGGEAQRVALIRGLSIDPDVIFLDEPCNGLDPTVRWELLSFLRQYVLKRKLLAVYVSHYSDELVRISDEIIYFRADGAKTSKLELHSLSSLSDAAGDSIPDSMAEYIAPGNYIGAWADADGLPPFGLEMQRVYAPEEIVVRDDPLSAIRIEQVFRFPTKAAYAMLELTGGIRLIVLSTQTLPMGTSVSISV